MGSADSVLGCGGGGAGAGCGRCDRNCVRLRPVADSLEEVATRPRAQEGTEGYDHPVMSAEHKYPDFVATSSNVPPIPDDDRWGGPGASDRSAHHAGDVDGGTGATSADDVAQAQKVVKNFVKGIVKGRTIRVLSTHGGTAECIVTLDRKLTVLSIQRAGKKDGKKRGIPLERVVEICVGADIRSAIELPVDDVCVVLVLDDKQAIGFRFDDVEDRDTFALCMSMFVDGRRNEGGL